MLPLHVSLIDTMTPDEKKYRQTLGKLYTLKKKTYRNHYMGEELEFLLMPYDLGKRSGWWHVVCQVLNHKDGVYDPDAYYVPAKEFMLKAQVCQSDSFLSNKK